MDWVEYEVYLPRFHAHWQRLLKRFDINSPQASAIFVELCSCYGGNSRYYHSIKHIVFMLDLLEQVRKDVPKWFKNPVVDAAIELGVWYHDAIYDAPRQDNEERSAELGEISARNLGFPTAVGELVKRYIRATDHKSMRDDLGAQILCDLDLAPLGLPWDEFRENSLKIQFEYVHLPNDVFKAGRAEFFRTMLDQEKRPKVFQTNYFYGLFETDARGNMRRALRKDLAD